MFTKVILTTCLITLTNAAYQGPLAGGQPAALYPAGLDPRSCPNFPICNNPSVAALQNVQPRQASASYETRLNFQDEKPVYEPRHTDTPLIQPARYSLPEFQFVPRAAKINQYTQPRQSSPSYFAPPQQNQQPQQFAPSQNYAPPQQYSANSRDEQYTPEQKKALDRGEYIGDGDYHGEGLAEALAPEYLGQQQSHRAGAPAVQDNTPGYQKVSTFLAQSQNVRQTPTDCHSRGYC